MTAMLGRFRHAGCGSGRCRHCGDGNETRAFKRIEAREVAREVLGHAAREAAAPFAGCEHGCNGSPCNSGSCRFWCHEGPVTGNGRR